MKKRTFLLFIVFLLLLLGTVALAAVNNTENKDKILTGEKMTSVEKSYEEIDVNLMRGGNNSTLNYVVTMANEYLVDINVDKQFLEEESVIQKYNNALESRQETVISNKDIILKVNSQTGELLSYINKKAEFVTNTLSDSEIKEISNKIFNNLDTVKTGYEEIYLEKFDEEIWRAGFAKVYNGKVNEAESIKFSFCPETEEIVTLSINNIGFDNNEVILSENDARNIAQIYLNESVADDMNISMEIVRPNYFYAEVPENDSMYINVGRTRMAYVCTFNNEAKSTVFVDCTSGEIIGGNMILGGEY